MVGTVGTRPVNHLVRLIYQRIELYPHSQIYGGYKGGTVGTKRSSLGCVPRLAP